MLVYGECEYTQIVIIIIISINIIIIHTQTRVHIVHIFLGSTTLLKMIGLITMKT